MPKSHMYRVDKVGAAIWKEFRECLVGPGRFERDFKRPEDRSDAEQLECRLTAIDRHIEYHKRRLRVVVRLRWLLDVYEVGGYTPGILLERQHKRQEDIKQLEAERAQLLALCDNAVARAAKARDIQHLATELV